MEFHLNSETPRNIKFYFLNKLKNVYILGFQLIKYFLASLNYCD